MELTSTLEERESLLDYYYNVSNPSNLDHLPPSQVAFYLSTKREIEKLKKRRDFCREIVKKVLE
jgi:hypothetical protein